VSDAVGGAPQATVIELVASAVLAMAVVLIAVRWRLPEPRWARSWLGLGHLTELAVVRPTYRLAHGLARFDDRVLDRFVEAAARATQWLARGLAGFDLARVDGAVEGLAGGVRRLGRLARSPQTGQLHQYYLQAVVILAVGIVVLFVAR
jgi:hypothetical protein